MNTAKDKIAAGLDALERAKSSDTFALQSLVGAPSSIADLNRLASAMSSKRDRLKTLSDSIKTAIEKHREKKSQEFAQLGKVKLENGSTVDELGDTRRRALLDREMAAFARNARSASAEERAKLMTEIRETASKIAAVAHSWTDPVALLMRQTLSDPKRATYAANLSNAGPVAVENAVRDAVITGDASLAAAALDRHDAMPKESRKLVRFSKTEIAESLVAQEWAKARSLIAVAEIAADEAELAEAEAEGKRTTPEQKIGLGVKKSQLAELLSDADDNALVSHSKPTEPETKQKDYRISDEEWAAMIDAATIRESNNE